MPPLPLLLLALPLLALALREMSRRRYARSRGRALRPSLSLGASRASTQEPSILGVRVGVCFRSTSCPGAGTSVRRAGAKFSRPTRTFAWPSRFMSVLAGRGGRGVASRKEA